MTSRWRLLLLAGFVIAPSASVSAQEVHDVVIINGRVIDPESGLDAIRSIGIRGGRIEAIRSPSTGSIA